MDSPVSQSQSPTPFSFPSPTPFTTPLPPPSTSSSIHDTVNNTFNQLSSLPLQQEAPSTHTTLSAESIQWMEEALTDKQKPYRVRHGELRIDVYRETMIPFATQHLTLLLDVLKKQWNQLPQTSFVFYSWGAAKEQGTDLGGLSRHFWHHFLPNIAEQTKDHPLLKSDDAGFYKLERKRTLEMTKEETTLCQQIGNLLCLFASGLGKNVKLGPVFPTHFYAGLLHLYVKYAQVPCPPSFQEMPLIDQQKLCYIFARENQYGIKDINNHLLFSLPPTKESHTGEMGCITHYNPEDLHKVWLLLHYQLGEEGQSTLLRRFPEMSEFINYSDISFIKPQDLERFAETFKKSLSSQEDNEAFIQETIWQCAFDLYHLECEPLFAVMQGFKEIAVENATPFLTSCLERSLAAASQALSALVQYPPFTKEAFLDVLLGRSSGVTDKVREKMQWVQEWYNTQAKEKQMKKLLTCINGGEGFTPDIRFTFEKSAGNYSIFHSCTRTVNMGDELLKEQNQELFIKKWRKHVKFGLLSGFSRR